MAGVIRRLASYSGAINSIKYVLSRQQHTPSNDVVVLYQRRTRTQSAYFALITTGAMLQVVMWVYLLLSPLGDYMLVRRAKRLGLDKPKIADRAVDISKTPTDNAYYNKLLLLMEHSTSVKWRLSVSLLTLAVGTLFAITSLIYPTRHINKISLIKSTKMLCFQTFTPLGRTQTFEVPHYVVKCRRQVPDLTLLKVKGHALFYLAYVNKAQYPAGRRAFNMLLSVP